MKKLSFLIAMLLIYSSAAFAQIGFNNDGSQPDPSAGLDVKFSDKGLLIPRVALVQISLATPVASPAISLMVYNTASVNDVTPGYYYWSGTSWVRFSVFNGGSGTTNYVTKWATDGTLGNSQLFDNGTNVGIGTTTPWEKLTVFGKIYVNNGNNTAFEVPYSGRIQIGDGGSEGDDYISNIYQSGNSLVYDAFGDAFSPLIPGSGGDHLFRVSYNNKGFAETTDAMYINKYGNVGIGTLDPEILLQVHSNTTFGYGITPVVRISDNFKSWNLGLGFEGDRFSIASEDLTERLVILKSNGNVGIGTTTPGAKLDVAGTVKIADGTQGADKVLTSDANGLASWQNSELTQLVSTSIANCINLLGSASAGSGSYPTSVAVLGNYAYVLNNMSNTMTIFNISDPATPSQVSLVSTGDYPSSVAVSSNFAYVVNWGSSTMTIYDVIDPASPYQLSSVNTGEMPLSVAVSGNYAYVANAGSNTVTIYNVSNPANPGLVGTVNTGEEAFPRSIAVSGNYAYIANDGSNTMAIYNVIDPYNPIQVSYVSTGNYPNSVAVSGNYAYVANISSNTVTIYNVSNPASPIQVSSVNTGIQPVSVSVSGNLAIVANGMSNTITIYNVIDPYNPIQVNSMITGDYPNSVAISGNYAYVANYIGQNMQIFQIFCPQNLLVQDGEVVLVPATWSTLNDDIYNVNPGNVGIGTSTPGAKLDVAGGNIRTDQQVVSTLATGTAPLAVTSTTLVSNLNADLLDGKHASEFALASGSGNNATYRWATFATYIDGAEGWACDNRADLFGGVTPSNWTDGNAQASQMSSDKEVLRTLFTQKGYAKKNATIMNENYIMYSSTNGKVVMALFRIKNTTGSVINWIPYFYFSAYSGWNEWASVALNGVSKMYTGATGAAGVSLPIPANRVSTVIFVSTSGYPTTMPNTLTIRNCRLAFYNNSLLLPAGLEFIDDLDTATGGWEQ